MGGTGTGDGAAGGFGYRADAAGADRARALLRAWHAIETLTPRTYVREADLAAGGEIVRLSSKRMPWPSRRPARKGYVAYYQVYLGALAMEPATRMLVAAMDGEAGPARSEAEPRPAATQAAIASVLVDAEGVPVEGGASLSSFAWALPAALAGGSGGHGSWVEAETRLRDRLQGLLRRPLLDGRDAPLGYADLVAALNWLVAELGLPPDLVRGPSFASRLLVSEKARSDPGPAILNSYHLADLDRAAHAAARGRLPPAARAYLGMDVPESPVDVLTDRAGLARLLSPALFPAARWPAPGGSPLVSLQQAAANAAAGPLARGAGILAVNGPPGTGKTTLLRDIVAACVLRRAEAMCAFERPEEAFTAAGSTFEVRGRRVTPHRLDPSLRGEEVLVASSNNRAVENVSRELPALRAVDPGLDGLRHFRSLSDAIARAAADPEGTGRPLAAESRTWGLAAAVLGRQANRRDFVGGFWWDPDHGIRTWLSLALGESVDVRMRDADGKVTGKRRPALLDSEDPPRGPRQAHERWLAAREAFRARRARVAALLASAAAAERGAAGGLGLAEAEAACAELTRAGLAAAETARAARAAHAAAEAAEAAACRIAGASGSDGTDHGLRLLAARALDAARLAETRRVEAEAAEAVRAGLADRYREAAALVRMLRAAPLAEGTGRPVDAAFFAAGHEAWNRASPWLDAAAHAERDALFAEAMRVHEAFVLAAAAPVRANLLGFVTAATGPVPGLDEHLSDLWATLFLVVPVVSTTFASVGRMLAGLPDEALGWLVVDEAGQAPPQAALGALMRCRRAVVVGDPLQVEPVVTLPDPVTVRLCAEHALDAAAVMAPTASVQTFADLASPLRGSFRAGTGRRVTGLPLLVHRRCAEPMFGIANAAAYDGQMVHAPTPTGAGPAVAALGPSRWIHVPPPAGAEGRWRPEEGEALLDLLGRALSAGGGSPDLFVISPYREVADAVRALVRRQRRLFAPARVAAEAWARERIGTIHAFQGREAEAVVLLLGASGESARGSRRWAARTPNVLNVAVSRARTALYVVGDRDSWAGAGCFGLLADALPRDGAAPAEAA